MPGSEPKANPMPRKEAIVPLEPFQDQPELAWGRSCPVPEVGERHGGKDSCVLVSTGKG